jgi:ABC-2 type transport system permease protein
VPVTKYLVLINPLVYVAEGMRGAITPEVPHMPIVASVSALVLLAGGFWYWGKRTFLRKALG